MSFFDQPDPDKQKFNFWDEVTYWGSIALIVLVVGVFLYWIFN